MRSPSAFGEDAPTVAPLATLAFAEHGAILAKRAVASKRRESS
ncbi:hypothetical protein [Allocoleopsis sp.]